MSDAEESPLASSEAPLVLVAGSGRLPVEVAAMFRERHTPVPAIAFEGLTDRALVGQSSSTRWLELGQLEALAEALRELAVPRLLLLGKIEKSLLFSRPETVNPDREAQQLLAARRDRSDEGLLAAIAEWLEQRGFELVEQAEALRSMLAPVGPITCHGPSEAALDDLQVARPIIEALSRSGVGQCVVLKQGAVLAVEAIEGTDETIRRAGRLGGAGATVVKILRAGQDRRFDLPTIGPGTIEAMAEADAHALAIEAGSALIVERQRCIAEAERRGIAIWGFEPGRGSA
jgi:DUF1009 family protein